MEKKKGISGSTLKMIAIVTMLIDHIGAAVLARLLMVNGLGELDQTNTDAIMQWLSANGALYWMYTVMRMIGRVAFPIFCFLLVEGFLHTHDVKKYAMRLGLFALLSEIPFDLAFSSKILEFNYQNVFFTLFIGLLTMIAYRAVEEKEEWNQALKVILYILIVAAGRAGVVTKDYVAPGQTVIDVGINVNAEGKLCGDVAYAEVEPIVDAITPVPGGVGSVTTSVLVGHVVEAAKRKYM